MSTHSNQQTQQKSHLSLFQHPDSYSHRQLQPISVIVIHNSLTPIPDEDTDISHLYVRKGLFYNCFLSGKLTRNEVYNAL